MSGWLTNGVNQISAFTGNEQLPLDTQLTQGQTPQNGQTSLIALAAALRWLNSSVDKTTVAGTRYYTSIEIGFPQLVTGIQVLIGGTGATDLWIFELHDATGALVATTSASGTTAGTANTWQRIALTTPYLAAPGTYFIALQSNGTSAKPAVYSSAGVPLLTGTAAGSFGVAAAITPPTTYTASTGPVAMVY